MESQHIKSYTLPSRSKSQPHKPKLVKEYVFANTTSKTEKKMPIEKMNYGLKEFEGEKNKVFYT